MQQITAVSSSFEGTMIAPREKAPVEKKRLPPPAKITQNYNSASVRSP